MSNRPSRATTLLQYIPDFRGKDETLPTSKHSEYTRVAAATKYLGASQTKFRDLADADVIPCR